MTVSIRRIRPDDGPVLRDVRLRALLDTPSAFARTHQEESAYPAARWHERAEWSAVGDHSVYFLSFATGENIACGMVGGYLPGGAAIPDLVSMWVAPEHRGSSVAEDLVDHVVHWARMSNYPSIELWVTRGNDRAHAFYNRCGFRATGAHAPLPSDPCAEELRMARTIEP